MVVFIFIQIQNKLLFANNGEPDQTPHFAASDLVLRCLLMSYQWTLGLYGLINSRIVSQSFILLLLKSQVTGFNNLGLSIFANPFVSNKPCMHTSTAFKIPYNKTV